MIEVSVNQNSRPTSDHLCLARSLRLRCIWVALPIVLVVALSVAPTSHAQPTHAAWSELLQRCVVETFDGHSTAVDYDCFGASQQPLDDYLATLSDVPRTEFDQWTRDERLAFLINAYNAWTVALILSAWPDLESIKDLGNFLRSPWKKAFIPLFGDEISLDDIEHGMIRAPGRYDDPRIHFAVNCASIGCPALRREAYTTESLDEQLEDQTRRFLADRSRNRLQGDRLALSPLFDWYAVDFDRNWRGTGNRRGFLARYAESLGLNTTQTGELQSGELGLDFLPYNWSLNAVRR